MAYRISYGQTVTKQYFTEKRSAPKWGKLTFFVLLVGLLLAYSLFGSSAFSKDTSGTEAALQVFSSELKAGEGFKTALTSFCKEIINGAQLS